jgi:hypothetical protein
LWFSIHNQMTCRYRAGATAVRPQGRFTSFVLEGAPDAPDDGTLDAGGAVLLVVVRFALDPLLPHAVRAIATRNTNAIRRIATP